jgi:osmotically-inducible protein OsmY
MGGRDVSRGRGPDAGRRREPDQYLAERIRETLAEDPRVGELYVGVTIAGDEIFLAGSVATEDRQRAMEEVVREVAPDHRVHNQTTVNPRSEPPEAEKLP